MKFKIKIKVGYLEGTTEFEAHSEYQLVSQLGYITGQMIGEMWENLEEINIRKVDENESNNV